MAICLASIITLYEIFALLSLYDNYYRSSTGKLNRLLSGAAPPLFTSTTLMMMVRKSLHFIFFISILVTVDCVSSVRPRFSTFMKESPLDGNVTRKVKMAANTIDRFRYKMFLCHFVPGRNSWNDSYLFKHMQYKPGHIPEKISHCKSVRDYLYGEWIC